MSFARHPLAISPDTIFYCVCLRSQTSLMGLTAKSAVLHSLVLSHSPGKGGSREYRKYNLFICANRYFILIAGEMCLYRRIIFNMDSFSNSRYHYEWE